MSAGTKADLVQSIDANAVIHHERNQANGDIEVVASARNGGTHESGPEDPHGKSLAARVFNHLFRYPFGLAVSEIEKLHVLVQVGLIQDALDRPAKHEGRRDVIELLGPSFERQPHDLVGSQHVRVAHAVVVEQVVHGCAVVEHRVDFIGEEIPDVLRQAQFGCPRSPQTGITRASNICISPASQGPIDSIAALSLCLP
jgi:hypothetical protein